MKKNLCLAFVFLFLYACGDTSEYLTEVQLLHRDSPLFQGYAIVFPHGFDVHKKNNDKEFYTAKIDDQGRISFYANDSLFSLVVYSEGNMYAGTLKKQNSEWIVRLVPENKQSVIDGIYGDINSNETLYCHHAWCRWKFCQRCCTSAHFQGCYHFYRSGSE